MAKKKSKDELDLDNVELDENGEPIEKGSKLSSILIAIIIIAIWLVIFALLIKMDVGGFGSTLRPILKNVPVINQILPEATDAEVAEETGYKYNNLAEAVNRIKELEKEVESYQNAASSNSNQVQELTAEVARLKTFEENQQYYEELKKKFDEEVVLNDNAPDINEYKTWYESIDSANAATIYQQVLEKMNYTKQVQDWAESYSKMEPANAAAILEEMTGDMNLVSAILLNMKSSQRALVLAEMDTVFAAKITKIMYPEQS